MHCLFISILRFRPLRNNTSRPQLQGSSTVRPSNAHDSSFPSYDHRQSACSESDTAAFNMGVHSRDSFLGKRRCVICGYANQRTSILLQYCYIVDHWILKWFATCAVELICGPLITFFRTLTHFSALALLHFHSTIFTVSSITSRDPIHAHARKRRTNYCIWSSPHRPGTVKLTILIISKSGFAAMRKQVQEDDDYPSVQVTAPEPFRLLCMAVASTNQKEKRK